MLYRQCPRKPESGQREPLLIAAAWAPAFAGVQSVPEMAV